MCGIAGIFQFTKPSIPGRDHDIAQMVGAMRHRGPDAEGYYSDEQVQLGHCRLAIIDPRAEANQPFHHDTGRYILVYNGEIYNYQALRAVMPGTGFRTDSDTEVLLARFVSDGLDAANAFHGMFAFAIWDRQAKTLYLCRDRFGVKPLYYYTSEQGLVFASELRALMHSRWLSRRLDRSALQTYLSAQSFHQPQAPLQDVRQLDPGTWLVVSAAGIRTVPYWTASSMLHRTSADLSDPVTAISRHLRKAVERRLVSDLPVAAFLSGGIDSSLVVGLMADVSAQRPSTFTLAFDEPAYDESPYAEQVARQFQTHHTTIRLRADDVLASLPEALDAMDIPSGDGINTYLVSKAVHQQGIRVALSGLGGDELFGRYPLFRRYRHWYRWRTIFNHTRSSRQWAAGMLRRREALPAHRLSALLSAPSLEPGDFYPALRQILDREAIHDLTTLPLDGSWPGMDIMRAQQAGMTEAPLFSRLSVAEYLGYTTNTLLKDTDQMGMAQSLEIREPFFDHELVAYMMQVPDKVKMQDRQLAKQILPQLPDAILHRPKQGFLFPWKEWMKGPLRAFCEERITAMADRNFIHGTALKNYWKRFVQGDPSIRWTEPWLFVVLEHWMEKNHVEA